MKNNNRRRHFMPVVIAISAMTVVTVGAENWKEIAVVPSSEVRFGPSHIYVSDVRQQVLPADGGRQIKFHLLVKQKGAQGLDVVEVIWCETQTAKMLEAHLPNGLTNYPAGDFEPIDQVYARPVWEAFKALCR